MSTIEQQMNTALEADLTSKHLDKFIADLQKDLGQTGIDAAALTKLATSDLVTAKIIPNLKLDGVKDGKLDLEDANAKHYSLTATADAPNTAKISDADGKAYTVNEKNELAEVKTAPAIVIGAKTPDERYCQRDASGRVTNAGNVDYTYDANGNLQAATWENTNKQKAGFQIKNGAWVDEDGKPFSSPPTIDQRTGALIFQKAPVDGKVQNIMVWPADGSTINFDPTTKLATEVDYANGEVRDFKYDANHKLTEVDHRQSSDPKAASDKWKLENGKWNNYGSDDKPTQKPALKDISVDGAATYTETNADGTKRIYAFDGSEGGNDKTERDVAMDGGKIHWKDGTIQSITSATNEKRSFTYDANGALSRVDYDDNKETGGSIYSWRKENGEWVNYGTDDKPVAGKDHLKDIGFTENGDYYETGKDDQRRTFHPNGKDETAAAPPPETTTTTGTKGNQTAGGQDGKDESKMTLHQRWVRHHHTEKAVIDADVQAGDSHTITFGDTMWDIAKSALKKNDGNEKPTNEQMNAEIARLAKNNEIANPNKPPIGKVIDTSPDQPATTTPPADPNATTGDKGQTIHYDGTGKGQDNVTEIDYPKSATYPDGMKVTFVRDTDKSIKEIDITGGGPEDGTIVKDGSQYKKTAKDGTTETINLIDVHSLDGMIRFLGVKKDANAPVNQDYNPDGTVSTE